MTYKAQDPSYTGHGSLSNVDLFPHASASEIRQRTQPECAVAYFISPIVVSGHAVTSRWDEIASS